MKGTSDTVGHLAFVVLVKPWGKKIIFPHAFIVLQGKHPDPVIEGRHFLCSLIMLMYQNLLNEVKLKKNYKITIYLYQIHLIDHQNHLGTLKTTLYSSALPWICWNKILCVFGVGWGRFMGEFWWSFGVGNHCSRYQSDKCHTNIQILNYLSYLPTVWQKLCFADSG